jgi:FAD/FMN-containing dehydrogenase
LIVGSEGTLGIVTEVTVRILKRPESVVTLLAVYEDAESAAQSVSDIIAAGIVPATLEMMDAPIIEAVERSMQCGYPLDAAAVLIIEVDGPAAGLRQQAERIREICRKNRCRSIREAKDATERDRLWAGRRGAFGAVARLAPNYLVNDCTVPRSRLPEALAKVAKIVREQRLVVGNVFHAGDGNLHPLVLFDSRDEDQVDRVQKAGRSIMEACVALGGTISGEHGIGVEKREALRMVYSEDTLEFQRGIKRAFDPRGLLNSGKIIPPPTEQRQACDGGQDARLAGEPELAPEDDDQACDLVRRAFRDRIPLEPLGNASRSPREGAAGRVRLRSTKLASIVEYDPVNQTVIAQAGMPLAALQKVLAERNQWLPLRPPLGQRSTIGGVVALNSCGPDRLHYGAPRDLLLGLNFVDGTGRLINAGGRVVKNVAGYDLTRLLCGSAGSLGFLTELTFRTLPLPEHCLALETHGEWETCAEAASELLDSSLEPASVIAVGDTSETAGRQWLMQVAYEGFAATVEDQVEQTRAIFEQVGLERCGPREYAPGEDLFAATFSRLHYAETLSRSDVPLGSLRPLVPQMIALAPNAEVFADFGCGRLHVVIPDLSDEASNALCRLTSELGGHTVLERTSAAPVALRSVAGKSLPERNLIRRLQEELDPHGVFAV